MKLACELPDTADRSLSLWTCAELARTLRRDGIVDTIAAFIAEWNAIAHPFKWTRSSLAKILAKVDAAIAAATAPVEPIEAAA